MIEAVALEKTYSTGSVATPVLKGISFHIDEGEYVAIMGASGTGKSTLMNILGCLDKPTRGTYHLAGTDVSLMNDDQLSEIRCRKIGFVFQSYNLIPQLTVLENIEVPLFYQGLSEHVSRRRAMELAGMVGIADRIGHRPTELSGGQQQRVAIARALITDPEIILADEPTGALDRKSGLEVMLIFRKLHQEGRTIILVTHDQAVADHAQRIIVLKDGKIAEDRRVEKQRNPDVELSTLAGGEDEQ